MAISINKLTYVFDETDVRAVNDISFEIFDGEIVSIVGHTGSGKSTLVQHFNGLIKPQIGDVIVNGMNTREKDLKSLRKNVGMLFQYPEHQLFGQTCYEDIIFGVRDEEIPELELKRRVLDILDFLELDVEILEKSPFELSGGQKRKVAIAGILIMNPDILVLDEPASGLDPHSRDKLFGMIKRLNSDKKITVIMVSHSMEDVANLSDRIVVLKDGCVKLIGTPEQVFGEEDAINECGLLLPQITSFCNGYFDAMERPRQVILTVNQAEQIIKQDIFGSAK